MDSDKSKDEEEKVEDQPSKEEPETKNDTPKTESDSSPEKEDQQEAPADALSRTPDDLEQEAATKETPTEETGEKKLSPLKRFFRKVNVYFLAFVIILVVAGAIAAVQFLNSQQEEAQVAIADQQLTEDALKQLANSDASVGTASQTLTIQGNAIITGQTLMRGNLNVAGNIQTGGSIQGPTLTISGATNLGDTQINSLQVANTLAVQGSTTMQDLNVAGTSSFNGAMTASQITVTRLILSGNAILQVPNHISFTGPTPTRTTNSAVLGTGGSVSLSGSDTAGSININTGNTTTPGCFARINFQQAFTNPPRVIVSPVGVAAGQTQFYVDRTTTGFSICTANAAPANQLFGFDYFVTN